MTNHEIFDYKTLLSVVLYLNVFGLRSPGALWRKRSKYLQTHTQVVLFAAKEIAFRSPPALEWHKDISRQRTSSLLFSRNTYDKTIWASSAISLLTQKVPVRRRDVIDIKVRLSHFVTWLVASFVVLRKGPKLVSTDLFIGIPVVAQS